MCLEQSAYFQTPVDPAILKIRYVVLKRFASKQIGRLPLVDREDKTRLSGLITRSDIVNPYNKKSRGKSSGYLLKAVNLKKVL